MIDAGSHSEVYKAYKQGTTEALALKVFAPKDARDKNSLEKEFDLMSKMKGEKNIVQVYEYCKRNGTSNIVY